MGWNDYRPKLEAIHQRWNQITELSCCNNPKAEELCSKLTEILSNRDSQNLAKLGRQTVHTSHVCWDSMLCNAHVWPCETRVEVGGKAEFKLKMAEFLLYSWNPWANTGSAISIVSHYCPFRITRLENSSCLLNFSAYTNILTLRATDLPPKECMHLTRKTRPQNPLSYIIRLRWGVTYLDPKNFHLPGMTSSYFYF